MEIPICQAKRIKLEHSYAFSECLECPVSVKEEKLCELNDVVENIKIEIDDDQVKDELVEPVTQEQCSFEYFDIPTRNEPEISPGQLLTVESVETHSIKSEIECVDVNIPVVSIKDPLELVNNDFQPPDKIKPAAKTSSEKKNRKKSDLNRNTSETTESKSFLRLQKEKDNLQKQIQKLRTELKSTKAREKALQTELGARRMAEITLEEKHAVLNDKLQESTKQEHVSNGIIIELKKQLSQMGKERLTKMDILEKSNKDLKAKLEKANARLKKVELEDKQKETKQEYLNAIIVQLQAKVDSQKKEMNERLASTKQAYDNFLKHTVRVTDLKKDMDTLKRANEELQKVLVNEKKMSRLFVQERDQQQQVLTTKIAESEKELLQQKHIIGSLTSALTQKITECRTHKDAVKVFKLNYHRKNLEVKTKLEELENKRVELENKVCKYCGFN